MTTLLTKAFEQAEQLPSSIQDEIATNLLEDIKNEVHWNSTLSQSGNKLEELSKNALRDFKNGKSKKMGFDEL